MTACPLDCYDACQVIVDQKGFKGGDEPYTNGCLCPHLNRYDDRTHIQEARIEDTKVSVEKACETLVELLKSTPPQKVLFYRGSGNMGKMQGVTDHFFASYGAALTRGSLCDAAGQSGIVEGRGFNQVVTPEQISKSEVVVVWGRNPCVTSPHLLKAIEGKELIVIDPVRTSLAQKADLYIPVKPRGDFYLAVLLARFAIMEEMQDTEFIEAYTDNYEWFYEFTRSVRIKKMMERSDMMPSDIYAFLNRIKGKRTVFLVGAGVQKCAIGDSVLRAIDSFAALLGLFGKEGCGVSFIGDSMLGVTNPLAVKPKASEVMAVADFSKYDLVVFQASNALESMPDSNRVKRLLEGKKVVYFGLHENETAQRADLVIPAVDFRSKEDLRFSYVDDRVLKMDKEMDTQSGISEYDLAQKLCGAFEFPLQSQKEYIEAFLQSCTPLSPNLYRVSERSEIAYEEGFDSDEGDFLFIEEMDDRFEVPEGMFYFITPKSKKGLNTMFERPEGVHIHPGLGYTQGERLKISSEYGSVEMAVVLNENLRQDTVCIYAGTPGVNFLTPSKTGDCGLGAVYQEIAVKLEKL